MTTLPTFFNKKSQLCSKLLLPGLRDFSHSVSGKVSHPTYHPLRKRVKEKDLQSQMSPVDFSFEVDKFPKLSSWINSLLRNSCSSKLFATSFFTFSLPWLACLHIIAVKIKPPAKQPFVSEPLLHILCDGLQLCHGMEKNLQIFPIKPLPSRLLVPSF